MRWWGVWRKYRYSICMFPLRNYLNKLVLHFWKREFSLINNDNKSFGAYLLCWLFNIKLIQKSICWFCLFSAVTIYNQLRCRITHAQGHIFLFEKQWKAHNKFMKLDTHGKNQRSFLFLLSSLFRYKNKTISKKRNTLKTIARISLP